MPVKLSVIVCAYNEERLLPGCLHSLLAQTRLPDEIVVVNNGSTDRTARVASEVAGVRVVCEPQKGLARARETGRVAATGNVLAYLDADCRAPLHWLERVERRFGGRRRLAAVTGPYRFYDWDAVSRALLRAYDVVTAPAIHAIVHDLFGMGAVFYGGNFAVRVEALEAIGGFDTSIAFHGEDTNTGRRLSKVGRVALANECYLHTSARRYLALGRGQVLRLYVRNFVSEILRHRPSDTTYTDVRI